MAAFWRLTGRLLRKPRQRLRCRFCGRLHSSHRQLVSPGYLVFTLKESSRSISESARRWRCCLLATMNESHFIPGRRFACRGSQPMKTKFGCQANAPPRFTPQKQRASSSSINDFEPLQGVLDCLSWLGFALLFASFSPMVSSRRPPPLECSC